MIRIAVIVGSTRPGRRADAVARWVHQLARRHPAVLSGQATIDLIDLADYQLPLLDEPLPAIYNDYRNPHTTTWATAIAAFDGFVFVTPEYNHSIPAALKNAIDYLFTEWNDKAAGFVSYGVHGGTRAVEHLRLTLAEVKVACVRSQVPLSVFTDFKRTSPEDPGTLAPAPHHESALTALLDELITWTRALKQLRDNTAPQAVPA